MKKVNFDIKGGKPHPTYAGVTLYPILEETMNLGVRSNFALISPDHEISPHIHDVVEIFTIVSGNPTVLMDDVWVEVYPGTTIVAPPGELHAVRNNTTSDVLLQANFNVK